jgi:hypothetical protein
MINDLLVFQEHIFPENIVQNVIGKKEEISKIHFFGDSFGTKLQKEFQSQQIKRINWMPFPFTTKCESNPVIPPTPGPKGMNWSVIILPKFSSAAGSWFTFLLLLFVESFLLMISFVLFRISQQHLASKPQPSLQELSCSFRSFIRRGNRRTGSDDRRRGSERRNRPGD